MHGICSKRTQVAMKKISDAGTLIPDLRGKNPNPRAIPGEIVG